MVSTLLKFVLACLLQLGVYPNVNHLKELTEYFSHGTNNGRICFEHETTFSKILQELELSVKDPVMKEPCWWLGKGRVGRRVVKTFEVGFLMALIVSKIKEIKMIWDTQWKICLYTCVEGRKRDGKHNSLLLIKSWGCRGHYNWEIINYKVGGWWVGGWYTWFAIFGRNSQK